MKLATKLRSSLPGRNIMSVHPSMDPHALLEMEKEMGWPILREEEWKEKRKGRGADRDVGVLSFMTSAHRWEQKDMS